MFRRAGGGVFDDNGVPRLLIGGKFVLGDDAVSHLRMGGRFFAMGASIPPDVVAPIDPLAKFAIDFGARNGDVAQRAVQGPTLSNVFGDGNNAGSAGTGSPGAIALVVNMQPGGFNVSSSAQTNTQTIPIFGAGSQTAARNVCAAYYPRNSSSSFYRNRVCFFGKDGPGNYLGHWDASGVADTGSSRALRSAVLTQDPAGAWTGVIVLSRDSAGEFKVRTVTPDGTVTVGDAFTPATWIGNATPTNPTSIGRFHGATAAFGQYFPGSVCDFVQLDGTHGTDAEWSDFAKGANPASIWTSSLAAHYRLGGTTDLAKTAGSRSYAAATLVGSGHLEGTQLRAVRSAANGLLAVPLFRGYVHALDPADVRAAANLAAVQALTGSIVRDIVIVGAATHVQARAVRVGDDVVVKDWTRVTAVATSGRVLASLPGVKVGKYRVEYRREDDPNVIAIARHDDRVGIVAALTGQSQTAIAIKDSTSVTLTPNATTDVSYLYMRGAGTAFDAPDGGYLSAQKQLSDGMVALAKYWDGLSSGVPLELINLAHSGRGLTDVMYHFSGDGLDLLGDGVTPSSGMYSAVLLAKQKRITMFAVSWATNDASTAPSGGTINVGTTIYGTRNGLAERPWVEKMAELFGGVEKSTAAAPERSERSNLAELGLLAFKPWVVMLPASRHRDNTNAVAAVDSQYGAMRNIQQAWADAGTGRNSNLIDATVGAFQIDTYLPNVESAHQDVTDPRGNIQFCLRFGQAVASAAKVSTINPRAKLTAATGTGTAVLSITTTLVNGGSLMTGVAAAVPEEFEVSENNGAWSKRGGAIPFTPALVGNAVTLTRNSGNWHANTRVRYLSGWPCAIGSTSAAAEGTLLGGMLYESRADAVPAGIGTLPAGVPLMPTFTDLQAA